MKALCIALALLLPVTAFAQELKLEYVPPWHMLNGQACYYFADAQKLVEVDSKLKLCQVEESEYPKAIEKLHLANVDLVTAGQKKDEALKARDDQVKQLADDLKSCTKLKNDCEAKWTPGLGWAIAGGVSLVLIGILIGFFAIPKK